MRNKEVANLLYEIADFLEMEDVEWKPRAYRRAARNIESLSEDVEGLYERGELQEIEGVGESISEKIMEYLKTGELEYYEELKEELPVDMDRLTAVEGLGPKSVKELYEKLGVTDLDELEQAAEEGKIADIEGFGEKSQQEILGHIEAARNRQGRILLGEAYPVAKGIERKLEESSNFDRVNVVGSFRRRKETVGDLDVLATSDSPENAMDEFCNMEEVEEVINKGQTKSSITVFGGLRIDLLIIEEESYGAALQYFTGSIDHNIKLRSIAERNGWKLNEYGLFSDEEQIAGKTEEEIYGELGMAYVPPELRKNTGEIDAAEKGDLPNLVEQDDIRGDMQMHTRHSDGSSTVREMAEKADELGYNYILVTDHGPALPIANAPESIEQFRQQKEEIEEVNEDVDVEVLHGVEANITPDGLDITKEECGEFDVIVAAFHERVNQPTERILKAFEKYPIDIFAHPLNRQIGRREPLNIDLDRVAEKAVEQNIALEINAQPARLDLPWNYVKKYRDQVKYVISTDAHSTSQMDLMHFGVSVARRGWCEKQNILNAQMLEELMDYFE